MAAGLVLSALASVLVVLGSTVASIFTNLGGKQDECRASDVLK